MMEDPKLVSGCRCGRSVSMPSESPSSLSLRSEMRSSLSCDILPLEKVLGLMVRWSSSSKKEVSSCCWAVCSLCLLLLSMELVLRGS